MSFLGALFKPFKKLVKKIGRGIKKVVKKIGKVVNKLGIVGQIGMMFLMPYAMGALGSFLGNIGGAVVGKLGQWGTSLLTKSGIGSRALGHTLKAISNVGNAVGTAYTNVTSAISNTFDTIVNKAKEVTGIGTPTSYQRISPSDVTDPIGTIPTDLVGTTPVTTPAVKVDIDIAGIEKNFPKIDTPKIDIPKINTSGITSTANEIAARSLDDYSIKIPGLETPSLLEAPPSFMARTKEFVKDKATEIYTDVKDQVVADARELANQPIEMLKKQAAAKTKEALYSAVGMEANPTQANDLEVASAFNADGVWSSTRDDVPLDLVNQFAAVGNNYTPYSVANRDYTNNFLNSFNSQNNYSAADAYTGYYLAPNVNKQLGGFA